MVFITRKKDYPVGGPIAIGFASIQVKEVKNSRYEVIDHAGRSESELIEVLKRCVDVDRIMTS